MVRDFTFSNDRYLNNLLIELGRARDELADRHPHLLKSGSPNDVFNHRRADVFSNLQFFREIVEICIEQKFMGSFLADISAQLGSFAELKEEARRQVASFLYLRLKGWEYMSKSLFALDLSLREDASAKYRETCEMVKMYYPHAFEDGAVDPDRPLATVTYLPFRQP